MNLGAQMVSCGPGPGPDHQPKWTWRFGDSDFTRWYFTAQVLQLKSPLSFSSPSLAVSYIYVVQDCQLYNKEKGRKVTYANAQLYIKMGNSYSVLNKKLFKEKLNFVKISPDSLVS